MNEEIPLESIHRIVFGLVENETNQEVITIVLYGETNQKILLTVENLKWVSDMYKRYGFKINSINRLDLKHQNLWRESLRQKVGVLRS